MFMALDGYSDEAILTILDNMIWPILLVVSLFIAVFVPQTFRNANSIILVLYSSVPLGLLVLAESLCLISGHFDLSIGSITGFSGMFVGMLLGQCASCWGVISSPYLGIVLVLVVGGLIGLFNGIMISKFDINPFLQTLSTLIIFAGGVTALNTQSVTQLPQPYLYLGYHAHAAIGSLLFVFAVFAFVMRYTGFGQAIYGTGSNLEAARAVGISTDGVIMGVYTLAGTLAGLAGLVTTGYTTVVPADIGQGLLFPAFAAAVIGGVDLFGGRGKISGALGGVLLLGIIQAALNLSGVPTSQVQMVNGGVLLAAILLYNTQESIRTRILSQ